MPIPPNENHLALLYADGVRVGLEDFIYKNKRREELITNYYLVKRLVDFCKNNDIEILNCNEVRKKLNLSSVCNNSDN